jgi:hypothetical protein
MYKQEEKQQTPSEKLSKIIDSYYKSIYLAFKKGQNTELKISITPLNTKDYPIFQYTNYNGIDIDSNVSSRFEWEIVYLGENVYRKPGIINKLVLNTKPEEYEFFCKETAKYLTEIIINILESIPKEHSDTINLYASKNVIRPSTTDNQETLVKTQGGNGEVTCGALPCDSYCFESVCL